MSKLDRIRHFLNENKSVNFILRNLLVKLFLTHRNIAYVT